MFRTSMISARSLRSLRSTRSGVCPALGLVVGLVVGGSACFGPFPQQSTPTKTATSGNGGSGSGSGNGSGSTKGSGSAQGSGSGNGKASSKVPGPTDGFLSGAHVLISYKGASRAKASVTRSKAQALAHARRIAALARGATAEKFARLAKKHSDGPSAVQGGDLGTWKQGSMVPAFDRAILGLQHGAVTKEPVQTPFGYHVIMRHAVLPEVKVAAAHVLIAHVGALRAPTTVTRDAKEARVLCGKIARLAKGFDAKAFAALVGRHSDAPDKARGGLLGMWSSRSPGMPKSITAAVHALAIGGVSPPVMSPFGCHVFRRTALPPLYAGSHILIAFDGAQRAKATVTRSKDDARQLAAQLIATLAKVSPADLPAEFAKLAKTQSDGPSAARGGSLGEWPKGRMMPAFDAAVGKTPIGQVTQAPVETPFGFHVILRLAPKTKTP